VRAAHETVLKSTSAAKPRVVAVQDDLQSVATDAARARFVAVDVEASGMHAYRARACTVQLAWEDGGHIAVIDAVEMSISGLSDLFGARGPTKIVHDVAFDARLLADSGLELEGVHDTAIAARMLGRPATGLASLLDSELGLRIGKDMQHHDWRLRPLDDRMVAYLAQDVQHLEALHRRLWGEVVDKGIDEAVVEETRYRIACAIAAARQDPTLPTYLRLKGADRLGERELAALRALVLLRELEAQARDVPPHKVAAHELVLAMASARPATWGELERIRGISISPETRPFFENALRALADAHDRVPDEERALIHPERLPTGILQARREREKRLVAWRRAEARRRGVDEQVVLPGHCLKTATAAEIATVEALATVPGIGAFRIRRDGEAIVAALIGDGAPA
jgi:ribonuclease D